MECSQWISSWADITHGCERWSVIMSHYLIRYSIQIKWRNTIKIEIAVNSFLFIYFPLVFFISTEFSCHSFFLHLEKHNCLCLFAHFAFLCFLHALRLFTANRLQWFLTHDFLIKNQFSEEYSSLWALRGDRLMTVTSIISSQRLVTPNTRMTMTDKDNEQSKYWRCGSGGH